MMLEGSKILLVEDSPETTELLTDCLLLNDCKVLQAGTGKAALELLARHQFDIAILDINLPDANGIGLIDAIKEHDPTIATVMITGYPDPQFVVDAMKKGASDFLVKPFELDRLMMVMMRVLRERELLLEKKNILDRLEDKKKIELLNRKLRKKIEELTIMFHVSSKLNGLSIVDDVYEKMVQLVTEVLEVRSCAYYLADNERGELLLVTQRPEGNGSAHRRTMPLSRDLLAKTTLSKGYLQKNERLFLPVIIKDACLGFILIEGKNGRGLSQDEIFLLKLITEKVSIKIENKMLYESLYNSILYTLSSLITTINRRDSYTDGHCSRVTEMSLAIGENLGVTEYEKNGLKIVGPIHDLGKIGVPDSILLKPGALTDEEFAIMKSHSIYGEEIMRRFDILSEEAVIIRHHHERYNGTGYPDRLDGETIPLACRIIAVCDAFDAMTSDRPYRKSLGRKEALAEIVRCRGTQFDPRAADCFIATFGG
jgi:response regulator RpfG family c-di-GMP phosphodiesterase